MNDELKETLFGDAMFRSLMLVLAILVGALVGVALSGCIHAPSPPLVNGSVVAPSVSPIVNHLIATSHPAIASIVQSIPAQIRAVTSAPPDLKPVSEWTNVLAVVGILILGIAVGAYFFEAALHQLAIGAAAGGIATTSYSLFVHTTLWLAPYVSGALLLFAVGVGVYETIFYLHKQATSTKALVPTLPLAVAPVAKHPFPDLATKVVTLTPNSVKMVPMAVTPPALGVLGTVEAEVKKVEGKI